ncbi:MAG: alkaline phosphatase family protein [Rhizobacter sp.]|nr:alkaline phosphatase family protein [Bacteriovorax sp.]
MNDLRSFTPALCELMGITAPELANQNSYLDLKNKNGVIKKALIYCPDAFGTHAFKKYPELHQEMSKHSTHEVDLLSVFPPVTPVCFASLFTGGAPQEHGIIKYAKPILKCDTLFDALLRAGKKVAIVAVKNSSIDLLFKERELDYFSMDYDPLVTAKTFELLEKNEHDVIVVYHQEYDDLLHDTGLFSELAMKALEHHTDSWKMLLRQAEKSWQKDYVVCFTPDHGGHVDLKNGMGDHGENSPEDMELKHFFYFG